MPSNAFILIFIIILYMISRKKIHASAYVSNNNPNPEQNRIKLLIQIINDS